MKTDDLAENVPEPVLANRGVLTLLDATTGLRTSRYYTPWAFVFPLARKMQMLKLLGRLGRDTLDAEGRVSAWATDRVLPWTFWRTEALVE